MGSVYPVNKGINQPIVFKGLKAQYIWYLAGGVIALLIFFAVMYICGINPFACIFITGISGSLLCMYIYRLSHRYGPYGMMKTIARKSIPGILTCYSRTVFVHLHSFK